MIPRPSLELFYGDILRVIGTDQGIKKQKKLLVIEEKKLIEPDFLSLFGGLLIGIIVGSIPLMNSWFTNSFKIRICSRTTDCSIAHF